MVDLDIRRVCGPPPRWRLGLAAPFLDVKVYLYLAEYPMQRLHLASVRKPALAGQVPQFLPCRLP